MTPGYVFATRKGERLFSVPEAAAACNCTPQAIHRAIVIGKLKAQWYEPPSDGAEKRLLLRKEWLTAWRRGRRRAS